MDLLREAPDLATQAQVSLDRATRKIARGYALPSESAGRRAFRRMQSTPGTREPIPTTDASDTSGVTEEERFSGLLVQLLERPVTGVTVILAVATTLGVWAGVPVQYFVTAEPVFLLEPWRLLASALPHVDILHLAFNVYWTWILGRVIEERIGALRTLGLILLLAVVSDAAEYMVFSGGVGLSGVGYGLLGYLWARSRKDPSLRESIPKGTVQLFLAWFVLCIVLTYSGHMRVANLAHAAGCVVGGLIGLGWMRLTLALSTCTLVLAAFARPYLNIGGERAWEYAHYASLALEKGDDERALEWGAKAVEIDRNDAEAWFYYAITLHGLEQYEDALEAYERAIELDLSFADAVDMEELRAYVSSIE